MDNISQSICIVGAGPAGLVCALSLAQKGILPRIFEKNAGQIGRSRATGLQAGALRVLDALGVGETIRGWATPIFGSHVSFDHTPIRYIEFADKNAEVCDNLSINQSVTESVLIEALEKQAGIKIAWAKEAALNASALTFADGDVANPKYIIAADGRNSAIRKAAGIETEQTQDDEITFGCDATLGPEKSLDHDNMHQMFFPSGRMVFVPLPGPRRFKISGTFSKTIVKHKTPDPEQLEVLIYKRAGVTVREIDDIFLYRLGSVRAKSLTAGNVVLVGDAAQTFYPNGGFGLNTAIEQAAHLAQIVGAHADIKTYEARWADEVNSRFTVMNRLRQSIPKLQTVP